MYQRILIGHQKEPELAICHNRGGTRGRYAKKTRCGKENIAWFYGYVEMQNKLNTQSRRTRGAGEGGGRRRGDVGYRMQSGRQLGGASTH